MCVQTIISRPKKFYTQGQIPVFPPCVLRCNNHLCQYYIKNKKKVFKFLLDSIINCPSCRTLYGLIDTYKLYQRVTKPRLHQMIPQDTREVETK